MSCVVVDLIQCILEYLVWEIYISCQIKVKNRLQIYIQYFLAAEPWNFSIPYLPLIDPLSYELISLACDWLLTLRLTGVWNLSQSSPCGCSRGLCMVSSSEHFQAYDFPYLCCFITHGVL